jgi:hypothetical protein
LQSRVNKHCCAQPNSEPKVDWVCVETYSGSMRGHSSTPSSAGAHPQHGAALRSDHRVSRMMIQTIRSASLVGVGGRRHARCWKASMTVPRSSTLRASRVCAMHSRGLEPPRLVFSALVCSMHPRLCNRDGGVEIGRARKNKRLLAARGSGRRPLVTVECCEDLI